MKTVKMIRKDEMTRQEVEQLQAELIIVIAASLEPEKVIEVLAKYGYKMEVK